MSGNVSMYGRLTVDLIIVQPAFRAGFDDARAGAGFSKRYENADLDYQWFYETGRLFAACPESQQWNELPTRRRDVPAEMNAVYNAACRL